MPQTAAPVLGQPHTVQCLARKTLDGLNNHAAAEWSHDRDVTADPENTDSPLLTYRNLHFPELRTSHAGRYTCEGSLLSPALDNPLAGTADYDITLTRESGLVSQADILGGRGEGTIVPCVSFQTAQNKCYS